MAQRFEGKNLDEALNHAAQSLGVERYRIRHSVLLEKRGFLGGVKRVVIEADVNEEAVAPPAPAPAPVAAPAPAAQVEAPPYAAAPPARERSRGRGPREDRGGRRGGNRGSGGGRGRGREQHHEDDLRPGDFERFAVDTPVPEQGSETEAAKAVREWCEEVVDLARFDLVVRTEENDSQIHVRLYGRDTRRFVEHHGELLDAMQVLANKALVGRKTEKDIELDCEEFKSRRNQELEQQAREVADRVRRDGREELLPAMTPIERRIVHLTLQDDAEVATESRGDGFYKRVAIVPRSAAEPQGQTPSAS